MQRSIGIPAMLLLIVALPGFAWGEFQVVEHSLSFEEQSIQGHRIVYGTIELSDFDANALQAADLRVLLACPEALGKVALSSASLWEAAPSDWELVLDPEVCMTGLFFKTEIDTEYHAELGGIFKSWSDGAESAVLVLVFECAKVDCGCSTLITSGEIRFSMEVEDE